MCVSVQIFRDVGFAQVEAEDRTKQFVEMLNKELQFVETNKYKLVPVRTFTTTLQLVTMLKVFKISII